MSDGAKLAIKIFISVVVLVALLVGGLVAYTWYTGKNAPKVESAKDLASKVPKTQIREPKKVSPDAKVGVSVQSITAASPGSNASITIRTVRESKCTITVDYNGVLSKDTGLAPKVADQYGMVTWSWTVEPTVPEGKWPVKVLCSRFKESGMVIGYLEVKKAQ